LHILYQWIAAKRMQEETSFLLSSHQELKVDILSSAEEILIKNQKLILSP
jgi:hypothetical protein